MANSFILLANSPPRRFVFRTCDNWTNLFFFSSFLRSRTMIFPFNLNLKPRSNFQSLRNYVDIDIYIHPSFSSWSDFFPFPFQSLCIAFAWEEEEKNIERSQYFTPSLCQIFLFARSLLHCPICPRSCHMENRRDFPPPPFFPFLLF